MTLLADNDIILSLAAFDLLGETCAWLRIDPSAVEVLATARYRLRDPRLAKQYGNEGVKRAVAFVEEANIVAIPADRKEFDTLLGAPDKGYNIDPGEAILFAATAVQQADFLLATGDKRCLTDLVRYPGTGAVCARLSQRVLCLEYVLLQLIERLNFDVIQKRVWDVRRCNGAVRQAFGWSEPAGEASVREGLQSFVRDLDERTNGLLVTS